MRIREETLQDYEKTYTLVKNAFENAEHTDGTEQELVKALRKSEAFIPELSLVAEIDGQIVGHIMFTRVRVGNATVLVLAPLSVLPVYQRQGIGTALIKEGHRVAGALGYDYSVVLGSEKYYPRVGYLPAEQFGILPSFEVPSKNFMAYKIKEDAPSICGTLKYAKEFDIG